MALFLDGIFIEAESRKAINVCIRILHNYFRAYNNMAVNALSKEP